MRAPSRVLALQWHNDEDPSVEAAMTAMHVIGLPTVLVYDSEGREALRYTDFIPAPAFLKRSAASTNSNFPSAAGLWAATGGTSSARISWTGTRASTPPAQAILKARETPSTVLDWSRDR